MTLNSNDHSTVKTVHNENKIIEKKYTIKQEGKYFIAFLKANERSFKKKKQYAPEYRNKEKTHGE